MVKICVGNQVDTNKVSKKVPHSIGRTSSFVVEFSSEVKECDITTDSNVYTGHSCPVEKVTVYLYQNVVEKIVRMFYVKSIQPNNSYLREKCGIKIANEWLKKL